MHMGKTEVNSKEMLFLTVRKGTKVHVNVIVIDYY